MRFFLLLLTLLACAHFSFADDDSDHSTTIIHNIDLSGPGGPQAPNYSLILFDVAKLKKPGANAHVIFRQLTKRVRVEFTGNGLPRGKFWLGYANACSKSPSAWTHAHDFSVTSAFIATEKSIQKASLRDKGGNPVFEGKKVGLFKGSGKSSTLIDCKTIQ